MGSFEARVALIHATSVSIQPIHEAFATIWPTAETIDLLDSSLTTDRDAGQSAMSFVGRMAALVTHAELSGAQGVLFTCSAFGAAIETVASKSSVPVLKPNEPMFRTAVSSGARVGLLATHEPAVPDLVEEFRELAGGDAKLVTICVPEAREALLTGDAAGHDRLVAEAATRIEGAQVIMLAHFSTARAAPAVRQAVNSKVLTAPEEAVIALRNAVERRSSGQPRHPS